MAEDAAESVHGVDHVQNNLRVKREEGGAQNRQSGQQTSGQQSATSQTGSGQTGQQSATAQSAGQSGSTSQKTGSERAETKKS
jgi:hypothetical protein